MVRLAGGTSTTHLLSGSGTVEFVIELIESCGTLLIGTLLIGDRIEHRSNRVAASEQELTCEDP
jgi:hypothetical protein